MSWCWLGCYGDIGRTDAALPCPVPALTQFLRGGWVGGWGWEGAGGGVGWGVGGGWLTTKASPRRAGI